MHPIPGTITEVPKRRESSSSPTLAEAVAIARKAVLESDDLMAVERLAIMRLVSDAENRLYGH